MPRIFDIDEMPLTELPLEPALKVALDGGRASALSLPESTIGAIQ